MPWQDDPIVQEQRPSEAWKDDPVVEREPPVSLRGLGRAGALTLRNIAEGASWPVTLTGDALAQVVNFGLEKAGSDFRIAGASQGLQEFLEPLPKPQGKVEEIGSAVQRAVAGSGPFIGAGQVMQGAPAVVGDVGRVLAANPMLQAVSATTGALSSEAAREAGAGPVGQAAAGVAGAVAPSVVASAAQATVRGGIRGGEAGRQTVERNVEAFNRAGTQPTVGQATESRTARATESLLARTPGGSGPIVRTAQQQADDVSAALERRAMQLTGRAVSAERTGRQIETSIRGAGGFVERFRATQKRLYELLDNVIPSDKPVSVRETQRVLSDLTSPIQGAKETTQRLVNPKIASIAEGLNIDAQSGSVPYAALRQLRTRIGQELDNGLTSDVPAAQWKRLYGALSDDLRNAADTPEAMAAWRRADRFTRAGLQRIESIERVINRNGGPEAIFRAATSNTKDGASTLRAVMQSTDDEGKRMITATVLRRLGLAKAGVQGELGDQFSTETFLTNWNLLSPEAKRTLFNRYGDSFRADMDAVARFAANLREGSAVFRNPSGTAQASIQGGTVGAFAMSVLTGHMGIATGIAGTTAGANLMARLMANPNFVKWLAQSTRAPVSAVPSMLNRLAQQARETQDLDLAQAAVLLQDGQSQDPEPQQ